VTTSTQEKLERAVALGADTGVLYPDADWAAAARELTGGRGVDLVLDSTGSTWPESVSAVCLGGRVVVFGATLGDQATLAVRPVYLGQVSLLGTTMGSPRDFAGLLAMLDEGTWAPVIDTALPLSETEGAHERLLSGAQFGKVVLECS
jgi:NADPH:quinone reductase-like Zn-dependent oxidoreductase